MATIGNMAMIQYRMADVQARYSSQLSSYKNNQNSYSINKSTDDYNEFWDNITKDYDGYVQEQYKKLYNQVFGIEDDAEKSVSLKQASTDVESSANALSQFANTLNYGDKEYDTEAAQKHIEKFVDNYNTFIDKVGDSDNNQVLEKGVVMVNTAKVYTSALRRVGIELGSDNKLTFDKEKMGQVSATDFKSTFGEMGFSEKTAQKAQQINRLSGSFGAFGYNSSYNQSYAYNMGTLLSTYA